jgi:hypothetical protein
MYDERVVLALVVVLVVVAAVVYMYDGRKETAMSCTAAQRTAALAHAHAAMLNSASNVAWNATTALVAALEFGSLPAPFPGVGAKILSVIPAAAAINPGVLVAKVKSGDDAEFYRQVQVEPSTFLSHAVTEMKALSGHLQPGPDGLAPSSYTNLEWVSRQVGTLLGKCAPHVELDGCVARVRTRCH